MKQIRLGIPTGRIRACCEDRLAIFTGVAVDLSSGLLTTIRVGLELRASGLHWVQRFNRSTTLLLIRFVWMELRREKCARRMLSRIFLVVDRPVTSHRTNLEKHQRHCIAASYLSLVYLRFAVQHFGIFWWKSVAFQSYHMAIVTRHAFCDAYNMMHALFSILRLLVKQFKNKSALPFPNEDMPFFW